MEPFLSQVTVDAARRHSQRLKCRGRSSSTSVCLYTRVCTSSRLYKRTAEYGRGRSPILGTASLELGNQRCFEPKIQMSRKVIPPTCFNAPAGGGQSAWVGFSLSLSLSLSYFCPSLFLPLFLSFSLSLSLSLFFTREASRKCRVGTSRFSISQTVLFVDQTHAFRTPGGVVIEHI